MNGSSHPRVDLAAPVGGDPLRLLFLTPFPPSLEGAHGGSRVIAQLLDRLAVRHRVGLLCLRHDGEPPVDPKLRSALAFAVEVPRETPRSLPRRSVRSVRSRLRLLAGTPLWASELDTPKFRDRLHELRAGWRPEIVQLEYPVMGIYLDEIRAASCGTVLAVHEPSTNAAIDLGRSSDGDRMLRWLDVRAWRRFESDVLTRVDAAVAFTRRDVEALSNLAPTADVVRIPFGTDFYARANSPPAIGDDQSVLFVGNFVHPPNVDAADRLISVIFPLVRERVPTARLTVVGDNPPAELRARAGAGATVTGRVPDIVPFIERAAVVAAPLRFGGGMRVKVLEALAAGKPVVASPLAVEGLDVSDGDQLLIAETDEAVADAIVRALNNRDLRARLGKGAWSWARENLSWDASIDAYDELYRRLMAGHRSPQSHEPADLPDRRRQQAVLGDESGS
jgi:glycosyltransferase involved in cell wall biosynthesis